VTYNRQNFLTTPIARLKFKQAWHAVRHNWPFRVEAFCLLPDHLHCIITLPENDSDYATRWRLIKGHFSRNYRKTGLVDHLPQSLSRVNRRELPVWQRRYWEHIIRDDEDYRHHVDYIHFNPVKHGYVKSAIDYPWSTFHRFVREGLCPSDWGTFDEGFETVDVAGE